MNPYEILGLAQSCTLQQIKETYRELSKLFHPDKQPHQYYDLSVQAFEEVDKAYKMISTEFNKMIYDNFGHIGIELVLENQNKFIDLQQEFDQGQDVKDKVRQKIIKLKLSQYEKMIYQDILKFQQFGINYQQTLSIMKQAHSVVGIRFPKWNQIESDLRCTIVFSPELKRRQDDEIHQAIYAEKTFTAQRVINLPYINLCQLRNETTFIESNMVKSVLVLAKKIDNLILSTAFQYKDQQIKPAIRIDFSDDQNNMINLSFSQQQQSLILQAYPKTNLEIQYQLSPAYQSISFDYYLYKQKYYQSGIKLIAIAGKDKNIIKYQSHFKFQIDKLIIDFQASYFSSHIQLDFEFSRYLSKYSIPYVFKITEFQFKHLLLFIIPQILPFIWNKGILQPNKKREDKKKQHLEQQLPSYQKQIEQVRQNMIQSESFQKYLQYEQNKNGLIIKLCYIGKYEEILLFKDKKTISPTLIDVTPQMQQEVHDSGIMIPPRSFDRFDGFFKLDVREDLDQHCGYVEYVYQNKENNKLWFWNESLRLGNVCDVSKPSLFLSLFKMILKN